MKIEYALIGLVLLGAVFNARGHESDWFRSLQTPQGGSCCNENDCEHTDSWEYKAGGFVVYKLGKAHPVPPEALVTRFTQSKPERATVCWDGEKIRCFVAGTMS